MEKEKKVTRPLKRGLREVREIVQQIKVIAAVDRTGLLTK